VASEERKKADPQSPGNTKTLLYKTFLRKVLKILGTWNTEPNLRIRESLNPKLTSSAGRSGKVDSVVSWLLDRKSCCKVWRGAKAAKDLFLSSLPLRCKT
jgi:hypothetical protein